MGHFTNRCPHPKRPVPSGNEIVSTAQCARHLGGEFYGDVARWFNDHQNDEKVYMYDKTRYSAFAGTDLDIRLRERHVDTLHLTGVCTDICVLHTAVDAYNLGYNIIVHENAVAALTPAGQEWALDHFKGVLGATVTDWFLTKKGFHATVF